MSNLRSLFIFTILPAALIALAIMFSAQRAARAQNLTSATELRLNQLISDASEIIYLRQQQERIAWKAKPQNDLLARINATLAEAGIPSTKLAGITGESDSAVTNDRSMRSVTSLRKQSMTITLNQTTPLELGAFLAAWRDSDDLWFIERIEMTHAQTRSARTTQAQDNDEQHYNVRLVVAALYHADTLTTRKN